MLTDNRLSEISMRLEAQAEEKIMQQLNWFIERGLLIVERGQSSLVSEIDPATGKHVVKFLSTVELKLKDKDNTWQGIWEPLDEIVSEIKYDEVLHDETRD